VFYGAQDRETAIAEVRPWVGARLYVAPWCAERELRLFDFEAQVQDPETEWAKYLRFVSRSLSYPVEPSANDTQYVITQYLVETIRNLENSRGSDGIRYGSAQKPGGYNIVVFDPGNLQPCGEPDYVEVTEVGYQHAKRDPPPDEAQPVRFALPGWLAGSVGTCAAAKGISREAFVIDAVVAATEDAEDIAIADQRTGDQTDPVVSWDEVRTEMAKGSDRDTPADP